jgi:hypothetical protein
MGNKLRTVEQSHLEVSRIIEQLLNAPPGWVAPGDERGVDPNLPEWSDKGGKPQPLLTPYSLIQFPFPGMVCDLRTGEFRWERPGDRVQYEPVWEWEISGKLVTAFVLALDGLPKEVQEQLKGLVAPANLKFLGGYFALWAGSHLIGIGGVFDVAIAVAAVATMGVDAAWLANDLWEFVEIGVDAKSHADLKRAAKHMTRVIMAVGPEAISAVFLKTKVTPPRRGGMTAFIEKLGWPGASKSVGDIHVPPIELDSFWASLRPRGRLRPDLSILPPSKITSAHGLRKVSRSSGMTVGAVMQAQWAAIETGLEPVFRYSKQARQLRVRGYPPKPELVKPKTIIVEDEYLGAPLNSRDQAAYFRPELPDRATLANLKKSDPQLHDRILARHSERMAEWNDDTIRADLQIAFVNGEFTLNGKLVVENASGKPFTGDYDLAYIWDPANQRMASPSDPRYQRLMELLGVAKVQVQHGPLWDWIPARTKDWIAKRRLIQSHFEDAPLFRFNSDGSVTLTWSIEDDLFDPQLWPDVKKRH